MRPRTASILRWVSLQLGRAATFLDNLTHPTSAGLKFIDLAPTDEADKEGVYAEALRPRRVLATCSGRQLPEKQTFRT